MTNGSDDYEPQVGDFGPDDDPVSIELPPDLAEAWADYVAASDIEREAEERKAKARDALLAFMRMHSARAGLIDSEEVLRVIARNPARVLDARAALAAQPGLIERYGRWQSYSPYIRLVGKHRGPRDD
jgi:hypothetical protein